MKIIQTETVWLPSGLFDGWPSSTQPRIEFSGAFYHVMVRGNRRDSIFHHADDRRFFLSTLFEACAVTGWRVHTWVLMGNHSHLFIETPEPN